METKMVGKWVPVYAEDVTPIPAGLVATRPSYSDTLTRMRSTQQNDSLNSTISAKKAYQIDRIIQTEMRSPLTITIKGNKRLVEKYFPGKKVTGTWKLKKKGKQIVIKGKEGMKRKVTMDFLSLTDSTAMVITHLPVADLKIKYRKEVK